MAVSAIVPAHTRHGKPSTAAGHKGSSPEAQFLNPHQAAEFLGLSASTLARWRMLRTGPNYSIVGSSTIRYERADLLAFASARKITTTVGV